VPVGEKKATLRCPANPKAHIPNMDLRYPFRSAGSVWIWIAIYVEPPGSDRGHYSAPRTGEFIRRGFSRQMGCVCLLSVRPMWIMRP